MAMTIEILTERVATLEKQMAQLLSNSEADAKKIKKEKKKAKKLEVREHFRQAL